MVGMYADVSENQIKMKENVFNSKVSPPMSKEASLRLASFTVSRTRSKMVKILPVPMSLDYWFLMSKHLNNVSYVLHFLCFFLCDDSYKKNHCVCTAVTVCCVISLHSSKLVYNMWNLYCELDIFIL